MQKKLLRKKLLRIEKIISNLETVFDYQFLDIEFLIEKN